MRKSTKVVAIVAAAALLALGAALTSFAAGWTQEDGVWVYLDKDGERVTEQWQKSVDGSWYYLDDNGEMAVDRLIEGDNTYYVDETGKMVTNAWKLIMLENEEEERWFYFGSSGKANKAAGKWYTINDKKYAFDGDGKMLYGWIGEDFGMISDDDGTAYQTGMYYCGDANDGARLSSAWIQLTVTDNESATDTSRWFYFGSNGKKVADKVNYKINGQKYTFDTEGVMKSGWTSTPDDTDIKNYNYHKGAADGSLQTGWFRKTAPSALNGGDEDTNHWYYAAGSGALKKMELAKINGKFYAFNDKGEMLAGLYKLEFTAPTENSLKTITPISKWDDDFSAKEFATASNADKKDGYYFFGDEETDGSMKTGSVSVTVDDSTKTMLLSTGGYKGAAVSGIKSNAYYKNGVKIKADADEKYAIYYNDGTKYALKTPAEVLALEGKEHEVVKDSKGNVIGQGVQSGLAKEYLVLSASGAVVKTGTKKTGSEYKLVFKGNKLDGVWMPY